MIEKFDIHFNVYSDTPPGKDPDAHSPTLKKYHKILWSKNLPNGQRFYLDDDCPGVLHHKSIIGEFLLSSDSIGHTYSTTKSLNDIVDKISEEEIQIFFALCSTIGAYIVFPANRINGKMTINGYRGFNQLIQDRFDLTLECIRLFYMQAKNPLTDVLDRYKVFFELFTDFKGYVDFFLLQDLVTSDYQSINYFLPFDRFEKNPLPKNLEEYLVYKKNVTKFVNKRNLRMLSDITSRS